jgi:hypothetical protein
MMFSMFQFFLTFHSCPLKLFKKQRKPRCSFNFSPVLPIYSAKEKVPYIIDNLKQLSLRSIRYFHALQTCYNLFGNLFAAGEQWTSELATVS